MIVAARARDRQSHEPTRHYVDLVVEHVVQVIHKTLPNRQKPEGCGGLLILVGRETVRGNLLDHEVIELYVAIEGTNNIVPVRIGVRVVQVFEIGVAFGVGVARDVEPEAPPTYFGEARRRSTSLA